MAVLDKAGVDALLSALLVINTTGDIEADELLARLRDVLDSYANISGVDSNTVPIKTGDGVLSDSSLAEATDRVTVSKDFETPPGSLFIGSGLRVSSGLNTLVFQRAGGTQQSLISMVPYDASGSSDPVDYALGAEVDFPVTTVFGTQLSSPQTLTFVPAVADSFVPQFKFRPATAGTLRIEGFTGTDVNGDRIIDFSFVVSSGQIGTEVTMTTPSPVLSFIGDQFTIRASGIDLFGGVQTAPDYVGQTLPFVTLRGHVVTQVQYTTPRTLASHLAAGDATVSGAIRTLLESLSADARLDSSAIKGLPTQNDLAFVSAVFTNSTRTLRLTRINGSFMDVIIPESTSPFLAPSITEFALPGTPSRIGTTDDLIGDLAIQFHITESTNQDTLSLLANSVNVGAVTTFTPDGLITGQTVNISAAEWTSITTADSTQVVFQLSGLDKDTPAGTTTSNTVTVQIADVAASEFFYYGLSASNNPATVDVSTLNSLEAASGTFNLNPIDPAAGDFIIFLAPQDHDLTTLTNRGTNVDERAVYTQTVGVRTISGQLYNSYAQGPTNDTPPVSYSATLA
jgi:hypothetical protein